MKKRIFIFFGFLILGVVLFIMVIMKTGINEIWLNLRQFSLLKFLFFVFLSGINFCLYALRWDIILRHLHGQHPRVPFFRIFLHRLSGFALSYLTPSAQTGGEPLRIMSLQHEGVPSKTAASSVIIDKALEFASLLLFVAVGITFALIDGSLPNKTEIIFVIGLIVIAAAVFWFYFSSVKDIGFFSSILRFTRLNRFSHLRKLEKKFIEIEKQMASFYKNNIRIFILLIFISLLISAFLLLEHYIVARFLGVRLNFFQTFMVSTIPYVAYLLPIPGGLGLLESGHAAVFAMMGVSINAFVVVFIIRMRDLVFILIGLFHASKQGIKMLKDAFFNK